MNESPLFKRQIHLKLISQTIQNRNKKAFLCSKNRNFVFEIENYGRFFFLYSYAFVKNVLNKNELYKIA